MKSYLFVILTAVPSTVLSFAPTPTGHVPHRTTTTLFSGEVMSELDIMCISNAADLCSFYDECDIEEREAFLNRFEEQTQIMAERMATIQSLAKHLRTGDHQHLEDEEVVNLKQKILATACNQTP